LIQTLIRILKLNRVPTLSTVYLQIYNHITDSWENLDSNNVANAGEVFTLMGNKDADAGNYLNPDGRVTCRIYQRIV